MTTCWLGNSLVKGSPNNYSPAVFTTFTHLRLLSRLTSPWLHTMGLPLHPHPPTAPTLSSQLDWEVGNNQCNYQNVRMGDLLCTINKQFEFQDFINTMADICSSAYSIFTSSVFSISCHHSLEKNKVFCSICIFSQEAGEYCTATQVDETVKVTVAIQLCNYEVGANK